MPAAEPQRPVASVTPHIETPPATFTPVPTPSDTPPAPTVEALPATLPPMDASPGPTWTFSPVPPLTGATVAPGAQAWQAQVLIDDGRCCVGGEVGARRELRVAFHAQGPGGPAREVRFQPGSACLSEADLSQAAWQPFVPAATITLKISAINWVGFWVSAQFRDAQGNTSPVVCDDISVEGMPALSPVSP